MTLDLAYKSWSMLPQNMGLSIKNNIIVRNVLLRRYNDVELEVFTEPFCRHLFKRSGHPQEWKTKAASILVHVLKWASESGFCKPPLFDYTVANDSERVKEERITSKPLHELSNDEPLVMVKPEALEKRKAELSKLPDFTIDNKTKTINVMKETKKIVQISSTTLKPFNTFESATDVFQKTGIRNIHRAIKNKKSAGGFYWCFEGEENDFKPEKAIRSTTTPKKEQKTATGHENGSQKPFGITTDLKTIVMMDITKFSDEELIEEIKRRKWQGTISFTKSITL